MPLRRRRMRVRPRTRRPAVKPIGLPSRQGPISERKSPIPSCLTESGPAEPTPAMSIPATIQREWRSQMTTPGRPARPTAADGDPGTGGPPCDGIPAWDADYGPAPDPTGPLAAVGDTYYHLTPEL